jgi:hypothetical protein
MRTLCVVATAVALFASRASLAAGWSGTEPSARLNNVTRTPTLTGPDLLERAPVITILSTATDLDGRTVDDVTLVSELVDLKRKFAMLRPGDAFNGKVVVVSPPETPTSVLQKYLRAVQAAGYTTISFAFLREIGVTGWSVGTAVNSSIVPRDNSNKSALRLSEYHDYGAFARELVSRRKVRPSVEIDLGDTRSLKRSRPTQKSDGRLTPGGG